MSEGTGSSVLLGVSGAARNACAALCVGSEVRLDTLVVGRFVLGK